ncbi:MAG: hypothetical protein ACKPEQ_13035, partial [Dolichospermum sp.]
QVINDGSTVSKTELCKRCEFTTKAGNPDYTKLKKHLDPLKIPDYTWKDVPSVRDNQELHRDYLGRITLGFTLCEDEIAHLVEREIKPANKKTLNGQSFFFCLFDDFQFVLSSVIYFVVIVRCITGQKLKDFLGGGED